MYRISVEANFSSAHRLRISGHKCESLHGHNWRVILTVEGQELDEYGMLIDFSVLKKLLRAEAEVFDHKMINDIPPFDTVNPTTENLCRHIANIVSPKLPHGVRVHSVIVYESDRNMGSWFPEL